MTKRAYKVVCINKATKERTEQPLSFQLFADQMFNEKVKTKLYHVNLYCNDELIKSNFEKP